MSLDSDNVFALLPVKSMGQAKQRLRPVLSATERRLLFRHSLIDVLEAISRSTELAGLVVISRDKDAIILAEQYGARIIVPDSDSGQSSAIRQAAEILAQDNIDCTLTIPGDVPLVTGAEIDSVCESLSTGHSITIVPNLDGTGSNCVACSAYGLVEYQFGDRSFDRHVASGRTNGIEPRALPLPGLGLDVDTPSDLEELMRRESSSRVQKYVRDSGIIDRLYRWSSAISGSVSQFAEAGAEA